VSAETETGQRSDAEPGEAFDEEQLRGRIAVLEEENRRLRREYLRARRSQYRRSAVGLAVVGLVALAGAAAFPALRSTLLVLAATGGFGAVLLYYLTPDQLVPASVGEAAYTAYRSHVAALREELGLQEQSVYVPLETPNGGDREVRLFVPQAADWDLPDAQSLRMTFVSPNQERQRGVAFSPTASTLWTAFERGTPTIEDSPASLTSQLGEAVVEQFELARTIETEVDDDGRRISIVARDVSYGTPTHVDHPLVSFVAVGIARGIDTSVEVRSVDPVEPGYRITLRYDESDAYSEVGSESNPDSESEETSDSSADS
jgi:hypothetical protein